jgi:hypothetical protein
VGKSALVAQLVFLNPGGQVLAYHCCQADTPETLRPARFVRSVAAMIAGKLPEYAARLDDPTVQEVLSVGSCEQDPASAFEAGVLAQLEYVPAPAEGVRYLLIDALDEALTQRAGGLTIVDLLASRLGRLPGWLRVVATTRKEPAVLDRLRGLRAQTLDAQDPRNRVDQARFLHQRLRSPQLAELLAAARLSHAEANERLLDKSAGNFLYLKQVLAGLEKGEVDFGRLDHLPPGLVGWYLRFFERHFPDSATYAGARVVLEVLVVAQQPLSREELAQVVRLGPDFCLAAVLRRLASFLGKQAGPTGEVGFALYHKSLADWLTDDSLAGSLHHVGAESGHHRLAEAGWGHYRQGVTHLSRYMLRYLPLHLLRSGRRDDLSALLNDPGYGERIEPGEAEDHFVRWGRFFKDEANAWIHGHEGGGKLIGARAERAAVLYREALSMYEKAYDIRRSHYPGFDMVNLLLLLGAMAKVKGEKEESDRCVAEASATARHLLQCRGKWPLYSDNDNIWHPATAADFYLICGEPERAAEQYRLALEAPNLQDFHRRSMRRQVESMLRSLGLLGRPIPRPFDNLDELFG